MKVLLYIPFAVMITLTHCWDKHMETSGMYQGDIQLTPIQRMKMMTGASPFSSIRDRKWPQGRIPYFIERSIGTKGRRAIAAAISDYHKYTCLRFHPRTTEHNYIYFYSGKGCHSPIGLVGVNRISLEYPGCQSKGTVLHEIAHSIGIQHEQCRPDRDHYVTVHYNNINGPWAPAFNIDRHADTLGLPYDFRSMMHYSQTAYAYPGKITITTKDPSKQYLLNTYSRIHGFSAGDINRINKMYKGICIAAGGTVGGVPDDCKNDNIYCDSWASRTPSECQVNPPYMLQYCRKACKAC